jgi:hypothetical protein
MFEGLGKGVKDTFRQHLEKYIEKENNHECEGYASLITKLKW